MVINNDFSKFSDEEYLNSPGRFRQEEEFRWIWDFSKSKIRAGHECVTEDDRNSSQSKRAKLTYGEVLDSGVFKMLYNLGAIKKRRLHDLGMGTGKLLIQAFLSFPNLDTCVGVELSKGRYLLAEHNLTQLLNGGWRGRKFEIIEFLEGVFMKIVEIPLNQKTEFRIGDSVVAYNSSLKRDKYEILDYNATVVGLSENKVIVRYNQKKT